MMTDHSPKSNLGRPIRPSKPLTRRSLLTGGLVLTTTLILPAVPRGAAAAGHRQTPTTISAAEWVEADHVGIASAQLAPGEGPSPVAFATDFPLRALAPSWSGAVGPGAVVEISLSPDGVDWSTPVAVAEASDGGRRDRDDRRFGHLLFHPGATFVQYQTYDPSGAPAILPGLRFSYFDGAPGPTLSQAVSAQEAPASVPLPPPPAPTGAAIPPPPVIPRAAWGADEGYRYAAVGEVWPVTYAPVEHVVIHHTETANFEEPLVAIRSVYYFHAITRGWGDIGYNFLIDFLGNIYEGRVGGEGAVAGHARFYNEGTCGIGLLGNFGARTITPEMRYSLHWLTAYLCRNFDPLAITPFVDIPALPAICAHRDVNPTGCPGETFYQELPSVRDAVTMLLASGQPEPRPAPAFLPGQAVLTTADGAALRQAPSHDSPLIVSMRRGESLAITAGPATTDDLAWYAVRGGDRGGWVSADLLQADAGSGVAPPPGPADPAVTEDAAMSSDESTAFPALAASTPLFSPGSLALTADGPLNLHNAPGLAAPLVASLPARSLVTILAGPEPADDTEWYHLDPGGGKPIGWATARYLQPI